MTNPFSVSKSEARVRVAPKARQVPPIEAYEPNPLAFTDSGQAVHLRERAAFLEAARR